MAIALSDDPKAISKIESLLSPDRLSSYLLAAAHNRSRAVKLYEWNSRVSGAFYVALQAIEVALRNASHRQLSLMFGESWFRSPRFLHLSAKLCKHLDDAIMEVRIHRQAIATPRIVPALSFGFWTMLYAPKFETKLWRPKNGLRKVFPRFRKVSGHVASRDLVAKRLHHLRIFRNRIAHHEPIFQRDLLADYTSLIEVAGWMDDVLPAWLGEISECPELLSRHP